MNNFNRFWNAGWDDYFAGRSVESNPYVPKSEEFNAWDMGWCDASATEPSGELEDFGPFDR